MLSGKSVKNAKDGQKTQLSNKRGQNVIWSQGKCVARSTSTRVKRNRTNPAKPAIKTTAATRKNAKHLTRSNAKHQNQRMVTNRQSRCVTGCQCTAVRTGKSARKYPRSNVGQNTRMIAEKYRKKYARPQKT